MGIDEAGRGPLAGPVVVAAVLLPKDFDATGIRDSKKLTARQRELFAEKILSTAVTAIEVVEANVIDDINILAATFRGMVTAAHRIARLHPDVTALVDGNQIPKGMPVPTASLVNGDDHDAAIAAASILAKTTRDQIMDHWSKTYPGYGFDSHAGYYCPSHIEALKRLGPCPIHRRSFEPIKSMVEQPCLTLGL
jgi:ribonuclease HII